MISMVGYFGWTRSSLTDEGAFDLATGYTYWTDFLFQGMFAATAATIVSGQLLTLKLGSWSLPFYCRFSISNCWFMAMGWFLSSLAYGEAVLFCYLSTLCWWMGALIAIYLLGAKWKIW